MSMYGKHPVRLGDERVRVVTEIVGESMTKQSFKDECDINNIMRRYENDGMVTHFNRFEGRYEDVADGVDYHEAMNVVVRAKDAFMSLPAQVRARFSNDPGLFLEFVSDPANRDEMQKLGLLDGKPVVEPPTVSPGVGAMPAVAGKGAQEPDSGS